MAYWSFVWFNAQMEWIHKSYRPNQKVVVIFLLPCSGWHPSTRRPSVTSMTPKHADRSDEVYE